jgi:hypothetical protein
MEGSDREGARLTLSRGIKAIPMMLSNTNTTITEKEEKF